MPQNGINHQGVTALAGAMQHNSDLRVLNLNDNTFTKRGALPMAQVRVYSAVTYMRDCVNTEKSNLNSKFATAHVCCH